MTTTPQDFSWRPPSSPQAREYKEILAFIEHLKKDNPRLGMAWFAAVAEADFWFWQAYVMSLGKLQIRDQGHRRYGHPWVMEKWFFDRMREVQDDFDSGRTMVLYQFGRGMFKSSAIQKGGILWHLGKDRTSTHLVYTHKLDQTGSQFGKDFKAEIDGNETLKDHWPQFRNPPQFTESQITLKRPPGIREASIQISGIMASAASGHFTHMWFDDAVAPEEHSPVVLAEIDNRLSLTAFLGHDDTKKYWIGVPSCEQDPVERRRVKGGFFRHVRRYPGIEAGDVYPLRSRKYYDQLRTECREDHFASQVLLKIIPPGMVYFKPEWLRRYSSTPERAAEGCRIAILIDPAEGKQQGKRKLSDFLVIEVLAFTFDRRRRSLDLWRERIGMAEAMDLLFGPLLGEEDDPENRWKIDAVGVRGLVGKWKRHDPNLSLWVENVGASQFDATIRRELRFRKTQEPRTPACTVRELRSNVKKEERIANCQPDYRNGVMEFPAAGYGHGSFTTDDSRDTLQQFLDDEYRLWTLSGDILNDDMLDLKAWPSQPSAVFPYPETPPGGFTSGMLVTESPFTSSPGVDSWREASWRVS